MSWLGNNGFSRESMKSLGEAYSQVNEGDCGSGGDKPMSKKNKKKAQYEEYEVSFEDGCLIEEGKKKCKEGYKWDSDKGKCVKKKKSSSKSSKTTVIVKGRGGMYGPGYIHGHGGSNGGDNGGEGETETGGESGGNGGGGE